MSNIERSEEIEAVRLALWHALDRPPDMIEVARLRDRLKQQGWAVAPTTTRGAVALIEQARYCVTYALNCPAHPWHGSDEARKWLIEAARLGGQ
jgi:hypothetical protein